MRYISFFLRITTHGFPLLVYGISDQNGRFHPVNFMLTSHETRRDFDIFYEGMIKMCDIFDIDFDPEYLMQDAQDASEAAIRAM